MARALRVRGFLSALLIVLYINYGVSQYLGPWMPIPNEVILKRLNINAPRFIQRFHTVNTDVTTEKAEAGKNNAIKLVEPQEFLGEFSIPTFKANIPEKRANPQTASEKCEHQGKNIRCREDEDITETENNSSGIATSTLASIRKAKKIKIDGNNSAGEKFGKNQEEIDNKFVNTPKTLTTLQEPEKFESSNTYEVTENSDLIDYSNSGVTNFKEPFGYFYDKPNENKNNKQKDFTQNLFEILDKYNIHREDKLSNYDQSLISETMKEAMNNKIIFLPFPLKLDRYNSVNHSPIDPLLAVFLSNYGYYLPNSYGIRNGYRNLYGYLASNNIHNNKPFGLYKIFSDTDSGSKLGYV